MRDGQPPVCLRLVCQSEVGEKKILVTCQHLYTFFQHVYFTMFDKAIMWTHIEQTCIDCYATFAENVTVKAKY